MGYFSDAYLWHSISMSSTDNEMDGLVRFTAYIYIYISSIFNFASSYPLYLFWVVPKYA